MNVACEATHAVESAVVVVESAVLLHEDDDVLDVCDAARVSCCRQDGGTSSADEYGGERKGGTHGWKDKCLIYLEELPKGMPKEASWPGGLAAVSHPDM